MWKTLLWNSRTYLCRQKELQIQGVSCGECIKVEVEISVQSLILGHTKAHPSYCINVGYSYIYDALINNQDKYVAIFTYARLFKTTANIRSISLNFTAFIIFP